MIDSSLLPPHDIILDYRFFIERKIDAMHWNATGGGGQSLFSIIGQCPFCCVPAPILLNDSDQHGYGTDYLRYVVIIRQCPCGWWEMVDGEHSDCFGDFVETGMLRSAILREFSIQDRELPIDLLREELNKRPQILYGLHSSKMEELVGSVFSEHFACEVVLCGRSHDGGFDLLLVESDNPTLVQVKRRTRPDKVESVAEVRHLLGATLLAGACACAFVTTADRFSREAKQAAIAAIEKGLVQRYELVDVHRFVDILHLASRPTLQNWKLALSPRWHGCPWAK